MIPVSRQTQDVYHWGDGGSGWRLLDEAGLSVIEETLAPGTGEVRHFHMQAMQCFYILDGTAMMTLDRDQLRLDAGMALPVPPQTPHTIFNDTDQTIRFLVISAPSTRGDRQTVGHDE